MRVNSQPAKAWDMKAFQKLLVMGSAYRQDAKPRTDTYAADPDNRLLSRGPRFRLGGEQLRDRALFASGLLVEASTVPTCDRICRRESGTRPRCEFAQLQTRRR